MTFLRIVIAVAWGSTEIAPDLSIGGESVREALLECDAAGIWRLED